MGSQTKVVASPTTAPPPAEASSQDLYESRLKYDPKVAEMEQQLAQQYYPQQAELQAALYQQYAPQIAQTQQDLRQQVMPEQSKLIEAMTQQALQRVQSPYGYTPDEEEALQGIRERQVGGLQEQLRTRANLGGGLYGGRAQATEQQAVTELEQAFAQQDINRKLQGGQQALQWGVPLAQMLYPQMQYPGAPATQAPVGQPVTPSADALYGAMAARQPQYFPSERKGFIGSYVL
jgi:hypothetical protein